MVLVIPFWKSDQASSNDFLLRGNAPPHPSTESQKLMDLKGPKQAYPGRTLNYQAGSFSSRKKYQRKKLNSLFAVTALVKDGKLK